MPRPGARRDGLMPGPLRAGGLLLVTGLLAACSAASGAAPPATAGPATATVRQGSLNAQVSQNGTLSYAAQADGGDYPVVNQAAGVYTKLPPVGQVINCGQVLYWVDDDPVVLLCGSRPFYRSLADGDDGWDVA